MQDKAKSPMSSEFSVVGTRPVRPDGVDKVTGRARFGADLNLSGQLTGAVLRSPHVHARVLKIDVSQALAQEGVKAVVTSRRTKVRNLVRPVDVGGLDDDETIKYVDTLEHYPGLEFAKRLTASERLSVGDSCDRIALALRWILSRSQSATEAMANAAKLREGGRSGDELLEYSFRRVFDGMSSQERRVLQVLCLFQRPLASEALVLGSTLSQGEVDTAVDCLVEDALVQRQFDPDTNDYMFFLRPIPSAFVQAQMAKHPGVADGIRRRLTDWYEAKDILDNERRLMVRELRQGRGSPELVLLDLAKASLRQGDYDAAEKQFEQSLARVPTSWRAAHEFAEFKRHSRHDRTGALKLYERAAAHSPRRGPDRARIFREFGLLLRDSGEPNATDQAIEKFEVALKETPNDPVAIYGLAQMLELKGHYDRMIELLEPLKAHPNPVTRERCLPKLLKAYEQRSELLKAAELRDILRNSA